MRLLVFGAGAAGAAALALSLSACRKPASDAAGQGDNACVAVQNSRFESVKDDLNLGSGAVGRRTLVFTRNTFTPNVGETGSFSCQGSTVFINGAPGATWDGATRTLHWTVLGEDVDFRRAE